MNTQRHRLAPTAPRGLAGRFIDRDRPVQFRLDGRAISGYAGDTVLSAVLATGIDILGRHRGQPVGLSHRASAIISHASLANDPQRAMPMSRTPAVEGAEFVTIGRKSKGWSRFFGGRTLGLPLDRPHVLDRPWRSVTGSTEPLTDLLVIGGGVAGLSAALAGARAGLRVTLVEATPALGGQSGLFGTQDGEDSPEQSMTRLSAEVRAQDAITVLLRAEAYALRPGRVRIHQVDMASGVPKARVADLDARHIVIATGSLERLPIFTGNRLPGVMGTLEAYELAVRYGVWGGGSALFATVSNPAYRLAMLARDAGIAVPRIIDGRPAPASRFIEFSRAYGMIQATGSLPARAEPTRAGGLVVDSGKGGATVTVDRLIVCGGWQPDLTLWHVAGGGSRWSSEHHRLDAVGVIEGIAIAGSAAGWTTRRGAIQSGADAIDLLLGRPRRPVDELRIDPIYESPDGPCPVAEATDGAETYLDSDAQLLRRPRRSSRGWRDLLRPARRRSGITALSEAPQPLTISEVAAAVDLELFPKDAAGVVAQERVALVPLAHAADEPEAELVPIADQEIPDFLAGRFAHAVVQRIETAEQRRLEPGTLIHRSADVSQPLMAIGVVLRQVNAVTYALLAGPALPAGTVVSVRDHGRAVPATIAAAPQP